MSALTAFNRSTPINDEQLRALAPSIFTRHGRPDLSDRFAPIPTIDIVRALAKENFLPFHAGQSRTRRVERGPFMKHMIRFRKLDDGEQMRRVGDNMLEIVLTNGNGGDAAYHLDAGIFRLICLNGMVVKSKDFGSVAVRHVGNDTIRRVVEGTFAVMQNADKALTAPDRWSRILLDSERQLAFARAAHDARFGEGAATRLTPVQILTPRRVEDEGRDLWKIFNVVQENLTVGGQLMRPTPDTHQHRRSRGITGITSNIRLNKDLWSLAEEVAEAA